MSNRDNFLWRPNDNSATTRLRYELEAEHWTRAFRNAEVNRSSNGSGRLFVVLALVIGIIINLITLIIMGLKSLINWIYKEFHKAKLRKNQRFVPLTDDEFEARIKSGKMKIINLYDN